MFNKNFYPTPRHVYDLMNVKPFNKIVLEPHGGAGHLIDYLKEDGAKKILTCELDPELALIAKSKAQFITNDFLSLSALDIAHVDQIVMNPPFDHAEKHILHAWDIAPSGCEIFALCNTETITNDYSKTRKQLSALLVNGNCTHIGSSFSNADRQTDVQTSIIYLKKPDQQSDFGDFFSDEQDEAFGNEEGGIITHNEIRSIVQSYVQAIKDYRSFQTHAKELQNSLSRLNISAPVKVEITYDKGVTTEEQFIKELQKKSWSFVFAKVKAEKYLTKGVKEDLNKFIEQNQSTPFTMKNIYTMLDILIQTRSQTLERALVEAVDYYTKYTHENRYQVEGWKTNAGHCLNEKFIINYIAKPKYQGGLEISYYGDIHERLEDLIKVICFILATDYSEIQPMTWASCPKPFVFSGNDAHYDPISKSYNNSLPKDRYSRPDGYNRFIANQWYTSHFFTFKVFKKGTMHIKFNDKKIWEALNRAYAKSKGQVLPEKL